MYALYRDTIALRGMYSSLSLMFTRSSRSPLFQHCFLLYVSLITPLKPNLPSHSFCPLVRNVSSSCLLAPLVLYFFNIAFSIQSLPITLLKPRPRPSACRRWLCKG